MALRKLLRGDLDPLDAGPDTPMRWNAILAVTGQVLAAQLPLGVSSRIDPRHAISSD